VAGSNIADRSAAPVFSVPHSRDGPLQLYIEQGCELQPLSTTGTPRAHHSAPRQRRRNDGIAVALIGASGIGLFAANVDGSSPLPPRSQAQLLPIAAASPPQPEATKLSSPRRRALTR
jgi:hypothetical protein